MGKSKNNNNIYQKLNVPLTLIRMPLLIASVFGVLAFTMLFDIYPRIIAKIAAKITPSVGIQQKRDKAINPVSCLYRQGS